jgi:SAM-dependent MidA family methyltransferase
MADLLRAGTRVPGFAAAARVHLVERSMRLRAQQRAALAQVPVTWHDDVTALPQGPLIVIANEFVDALPIRQFVRTPSGWSERHVALDGEAFQFIDMPVDADALPRNLPNAAVGDVVEDNAPARSWMGSVAKRIVRDGGALLVIDYGHTTSAPGDTLQAVRQHKFHPVLSDLGDADLTAHVDFAALAAAARAAGAAVLGPVLQGTWLAQLGIELRVAHLSRGRDAAAAKEIAAAARRLTAPDGMGLLFKVMAVVHPRLADPALAPLDGFAQDTTS